MVQARTGRVSGAVTTVKNQSSLLFGFLLKRDTILWRAKYTTAMKQRNRASNKIWAIGSTTAKSL